MYKFVYSIEVVQNVGKKDCMQVLHKIVDSADIVLDEKD